MNSKKIEIILFLGLNTNCSSQIRILLTAALNEAYFEFRKQQYIESFNILKKMGYEDFCVVEAIKKHGPTFLDDYVPHVFYSLLNDSRLKNYGINEAKTVFDALQYFKFQDDDIVIKMTGRYQFISDFFLKIVNNNPEYDTFVKIRNPGSVYTLCFAMRCKYLKEMLLNLDYNKMESQGRIGMILEQVVSKYINVKKKDRKFKVFYVEKLDVKANLFGISVPMANGIFEWN